MPDTEPISSNIYPSLTYHDAPAAIEWLCSAFGFTKRLVVPGPDGSVMRSELSLGPGVIMVSSAKPDAGRVSPRSLPAVNQALCVRIDDPDSHFARGGVMDGIRRRAGPALRGRPRRLRRIGGRGRRW